MSSGFVSGGTTDKPIERDDEWLEAQKELEANRRLKEEQSRQQGGKTLYEVLQSNKAAKQEAFEESIRLKNQFRNLDEDEIEFLDSVLESTRAKEEAIKKETTEQLDVFRRQQEEADKLLSLEEIGRDEDKAGSPTGEESQWAINSRKRKRVKEKEGIKGIKLRKSSSKDERPTVIGETMVKDSSQLATKAEDNKAIPELSTSTDPVENVNGLNRASLSTTTNGTTPSKRKVQVKAPPDKTKTTGLGLAGYSSDDDD